MHRYIAERGTPPLRSIAHKWLSGAGLTRAKVLRPEPLASPKQLAWTTVRTITTLPSHAAADLTRIRQDAEVARVVDLTQRFTKLMRACGLDGDQLADQVGELGGWLLETRTCGVAALETLAANLAQNRLAVQTALTTF